MGRYVPPDVEGTTTGNKLHKKHALGARASKLASSGILTVRFEMPYAVWCSSCPKPTIIGQGVRFNAEKKKVGTYYTTPIWQFRMRHADCGGAVEIRTDPKNTAYVVVSGAKKRDTGEDQGIVTEPKGGEMVIMTDEERQKLRSSAFASLEKTIEDRQQLVQAAERIDELEDASRRLWDDPYSRNKALRQTFRVGRKLREEEASVGEALKDKMSLGIDLVPASEEDARRAALVDFGPEVGAEDAQKVLAKPLFSAQGVPARTPVNAAKGIPKMELMVSKRRRDLVSEIVANTRMSQDPFLREPRTERLSGMIQGVKRKRDVASEEDTKPTDADPNPPLFNALAGYHSESD